jgi:multisubunit Na+/H+ antiporter MnhG subunit
MLEYIVVVGAVFSLLGALAYIRSMFKGETKPNRVTWFMWLLAPFIATAASLSNGVSWAVVPVFMAGFSPFLIFTASFFTKKAYWKLTTFDYLCGIISALALGLWLLTSLPDLAIILAIISDGLAAVPTFVKAWHNPKTESTWPFTIGMLSPMTVFLVARTWSFSELAFPAYLIVVNVLILIAIIKK